jgi:hypothetical protein
VTITASAAGVSSQAHNVSCFDNDTTFIFGGVNGIQEGQTGRKITVKLSGNPLEPRTAGITSLDMSRITVSPASLVFNSTNYMNPLEVTLTGLAEPASDGDNNVYISASADNIVTGSKAVVFCELRTVASSVPADAATNVNPTGGVITVVFNNRSDYFDVPALTTEAYDSATTYKTVPNSGTVLEWKGTSDPDNRTLLIHISWIRFPENTKLQWALSGTFINSGTTSGTFTTTINPHTYPVVDTGQTSCYYFSGTWLEDLLCS